MKIKLYLDGDTIKSALLSGDGSDKNGDLEILVSGAPMTQFKAYLMKEGWSLTNGKVGWDADGASAELSFASGSTKIDSVGIGAAFTVVTE